MGWASGVFTRVRDWTADAAVPLNIEATLMDQEDDNFEVGIDTCLTKDGQNTPTTNLPMDSNRHTGVGNAVAKTDYASAADVIDQDLLFYVDTGAADAYVITPSPSIGAYEEGQRLIFRATNTNTTTSTLNVNALGTRIIFTADGVALAAGAIVVGGYYEVTYDENTSPDRWVLTSPSSISQLNAAATETISAIWTFTGGIDLDDNDNLRFGTGNDVVFDFNATNFITVGAGTWNISGFTSINAGAVNADFDAITATSYGGITEANLVDKSATETVSGVWTFTGGIDLNDNDNLRFGTGNDVVFDFNATNFITVGSGAWNISGFTSIAAGTVNADFDAITATSYGGITEANLLDASTVDGTGLTETSGVLNVIGGDGITANADDIELTAAAASTTNPVDISTGVVSLDVEALTTIEGSALAATDTFYVEDAGVSKGIEVQSMGFRVQTGQTTQTLALSDANTIMEFNGTATLTIPLNGTVDFPTGIAIIIVVDHPTQVVLVDAVSSVNLNSVFHPGGVSSANDEVLPGGTAVLIHTEGNDWYLSGDIQD